jgi:hypothetical protein
LLLAVACGAGRALLQDGLARLPSHQEVSSYREEEVTQNERPIPEDLLQFVAEQLQELGPDNLQGEP